MKKIRELFRNTKLNIKFTSIIILFMVIPIGVLAGVLFYVMEQNAVQENMDYMEYTMQRNEDGIKTKIDSINMSTQFFPYDHRYHQRAKCIYDDYPRGGTLPAVLCVQLHYVSDHQPQAQPYLPAGRYFLDRGPGKHHGGDDEDL